MKALPSPYPAIGLPEPGTLERCCVMDEEVRDERATRESNGTDCYGFNNLTGFIYLVTKWE